MAKTVRLGFIGAGGIAQVHGDAVEAAGGKVLGVVDTDLAAAQRFAQRYGADHAGTEMSELLAIRQIDAVVVSTPNALHASHSIAALRAGKHVLCEKPMATTSSQCKAMIRAAQRARKMLTVGYVRRFLPESELIKSKIDQGCLGKIYWVEARWMRRRGVPGYGGWFTTKELSGGGPLIDLGCHMLDLVCWLLGQHRVARVSASVGCHLAKHNYVYTKMWGKPAVKGRYDVEDCASAMIRLANGTCALVQVSWAINMPKSDVTELWLAGDKAGCSWGDHVEFSGQDSGGLTDTRYELMESNGFDRQMAHFCTCVRTGGKPRVKPDEALKIQQVLEAIYRSSKVGREVVVK